jgi:hypothetical protein
LSTVRQLGHLPTADRNFSKPPKLLQKVYVLFSVAELDRKDPAELFDYLLANPLKTVIGGGRERQIIVIDALDEAGSASSVGEAGRNPLVELLARHAPRLPDWFGLVVTSRPESAVQTPLQGLNPFVLDTRTEANRAGQRHNLARGLRRPGPVPTRSGFGWRAAPGLVSSAPIRSHRRSVD